MKVHGTIYRTAGIKPDYVTNLWLGDNIIETRHFPTPESSKLWLRDEGVEDSDVQLVPNQGSSPRLKD